uniref:TROVE domain containing protein n=1 Tax=viral metagenome TaxID=1070528 RepID=A0A6C0EJU1_9ZZZZ
MSKFAKAMNASALTWNGALSYASPDPSGNINGRVALFFKGARGLNVPRLYEYLRECVRESIVDTFLLAFHLRDCRGGKGERELGRRALVWLFINRPVEFRKVLHLLSEYGRWDDLLQFFPGVLDLTDLDKVRSNYSADVPSQDHLANLKVLQQEVVDLVASQLSSDVANMTDGKPVSLCAKWTPTERDSLDRKFGVFKTLARALHTSPRNLRQMYNTPLREYLRVVEGFMCSGRWDTIDYNKVPSQCMRRLKKSFEKHDSERFAAWRAELQHPETSAKVNAGAMHPHELIREVRTKNFADPVTEAQYNVIRDQVRQAGSLKDCVAVVDTSSSMECMNSVPLDVAVTMGLLISDAVQGDFHGHVITFNNVPKFTVVPDGGLYDRWSTIRRMEWGGSTNLEGTFNLILQRGKECKLTDEDMPKRLFIISDMQFNHVEGYGNVTNMERINEMYQKEGYTRPQIVFWNVNGSSTDFPVTVDENGTAMISGFSPSILKSLLSGDEFSTESVLRKALDDSRYDKVREALGGFELL